MRIWGFWAAEPVINLRMVDKLLRDFMGQGLQV
jgi:hypothetical protein